MHVSELINKLFLNYHSFFYWRDLIEITFFATLFYYASLWLKKDTQKNLLPYFYIYCLCAFGTHFVGLTTISYTLFLFAPVTAMIFILLHQEILQKNAVTLKNITPAQRIKIDWLETIIKTSLITIDNGKPVTCVIERADNLQDLIHASLMCNAKLDQVLLNILIESSSFDSNKMIWINTKGELIGINAEWQTLQDTSFIFDATLHQLPYWKQQAIFYTTKTDAIVLHITPGTRTFDIILNGMVIDQMHATKAMELLKKYVIKNQSNYEYGEINHETFSQKRSFKQFTN